MALRAIIPFDRLPTAGVNLGTGVKLPGTQVYACDVAAQPSNYSRDANNWLVILSYYVSGVGNTTTKSLAVQANLKTLLGALSPTSVVTVGARIKAQGPNTGLNLQAPGTAATTFMLFGTNGFNADGSLGAPNANREIYMEATIDVANRVVYRWLDGVAIASLALPEWVATYFANNADLNLVFGYPGTYTSAAASYSTTAFKDIYVLEKTDDGIASSRLGPQVIKPILVSSIVADNWTNNGTDSNLTALRTPITTTASQSTPLVTSDVGETPAALKFNAGQVGTRINGVLLAEEAQRATASDARIRSTVNEGAVASPAVVTRLDTALDSYPFYVAARSPAGNKWTKDIIESLTINLVPTTGA